MHILLLKEITLIKAANENFIDVKNRLLAYSPFTDCFLKINGVLTDNAGNLDVVMPMYNSLEYSKSYREITGNLWNNYKDEANGFPANNHNANPIANSKSFKNKASIKQKTSNAN